MDVKKLIKEQLDQRWIKILSKEPKIDLELMEEKYGLNQTQGMITIINFLKSVEEYNGSLWIDFHYLEKSLGTIKRIGGDLILSKCGFESLGEIEFIGGNLEIIKCSNFKSIHNLKYIGGNLYIENSPVSDLGILKDIKGDCGVMGTNLSFLDFNNINVGGKKLLTLFKK